MMICGFVVAGRLAAGLKWIRVWRGEVLSYLIYRQIIFAGIFGFISPCANHSRRLSVLATGARLAVQMDAKEECRIFA